MQLPQFVSNLILAFDEPIYSDRILIHIKRWKGIKKFSPVHSLHQLKEHLFNDSSIMLVLDQHLTGLETILDIKKLIAEHNNVRSILFYNHRQQVQVNALNNVGFSALIPKIAPIYEAAHAISQVMKWRKYVHPHLQQQNSPAINQSASVNAIKPQTFSAREWEFINLLIAGFKVERICKDMVIKITTYKDYRKKITEKLKALGFNSIKEYLKAIS